MLFRSKDFKNFHDRYSNESSDNNDIPEDDEPPGPDEEGYGNF